MDCTRIVDHLLLTMCSGEGCTDTALFGMPEEAFLHKFMRLQQGIPGHDALSDLSKALHRNRFTQRLAERFTCDADRTIAIDRNSVPPSFNRAAGKSQLQVLAATAWLILTPVSVDGSSTEMVAIPTPLAMLHLKRCIVTADTTHTQGETERTVCDNGGD